MEECFDFVFRRRVNLSFFCLIPKVFRLNMVALYTTQRHLNLQGKSISTDFQCNYNILMVLIDSYKL